ncbi:hypothetical protein [Actinomyces qiguomingii]|uniref:hypothetical protein n=1 Tax=Actinomyces qiguomingii TaxID=2057800 RepID=UPI000CA00FF0|nr:hypothetical protein [Actinomyces qiguomingii]
MALRFNPPPNWPAPPEGFNPPAGWQPDPAWGPAPEGWQLWVEDSAPGAPANSAPQTGSAADAGWAPTQAVPTGSSAPVADPTGQSASAPSGDYAGGGSPYAANMNYAQSPTPYHNQQQAPGVSPQAAGWQPIDVGQGAPPGGNKPVTKQWWFWTIIAVVIIALVIGIIVALTRGNDDNDDSRASATSSSTASNDDSTSKPTEDDPTPEPTEDDPAPEPSKNASTPNQGGDSSSDKGATVSTAIDPENDSFIFEAGDYDSTDPNATVEIKVGSVEWDATSAVKADAGDLFWTEPGDGNVYMRVPVTAIYHGKGQLDGYKVKVDFVKDGNTTSRQDKMLLNSEFRFQDQPRDGGSVTGYFVFLLSEADAKAEEGVFAVEVFYGNDERYFQAKSF